MVEADDEAEGAPLKPFSSAAAIEKSGKKHATKSQGQTYTRIALYLPEPVFSHGQLYVSISRVRSPRELGIMILQTKTQGSFPLYPHRYFARNVVFKENL